MDGQGRGQWSSEEKRVEIVQKSISLWAWVSWRWGRRMQRDCVNFSLAPAGLTRMMRFGCPPLEGQLQNPFELCWSARSPPLLGKKGGMGFVLRHTAIWCYLCAMTTISFVPMAWCAPSELSASLLTWSLYVRQCDWFGNSGGSKASASTELMFLFRRLTGYE